MSLFVAAIALFLAVAIAWFASRRSGYRHARDTISELGETGTRDERAVSLGVFLPVGLALAVVAAQVRAAHPDQAVLAGSLAVGYLGSAIFRCDPGAPLSGSWRHALHNLAGGVEYVGGAFALWKLAEPFGPLYHVLGVVVALAIAVLSLEALHPWRGLVQRLAEAALFFGLGFALK
ncbi:MAG: DUF998 domain-containing protein [Candidatus Eisenbacteria bacterium]|uniref:DUF998 domain-containing protein n=1 Tax=Eiseniibacteriota bacterium TaxID=2212470 RepID=A0A849SE20_UNCEI|nr:DUF998 domain-containing protein [Candidatus Eisenbacteria bacterium]